MSLNPPPLRRRLGYSGISLLVLAASSSLLWSASSGTASAAGPLDPPVTIDFTSTAPTDAVVKGAAYKVAATDTGSSEPLVYRIDPATTNTACTIAGDVVSFIHVGSCVIAVEQAGDDTHANGEGTQTVNVAKGVQTIAFTLPATGKIGDTLPLGATSDSGLPVAYSVASATTACTVDDSTLILNAGGSCLITATQAGSADYTAAPSVNQTVAVEQIVTTTTLTFDNNTPAFGDKVIATATVADEVPGSVQFRLGANGIGESSPLVAGKTSLTLPDDIAVGSSTIYADFTPANKAKYATSTGARVLTVAQASQTITFAPLNTTKTAVGDTQTLVVTGGKSGSPVVLSTSTPGTCTVDGTTLTLTAKGLCKVTASQVGNGNYTAATSVDRTVTVAQVETTTALSFDKDKPTYGDKVTVIATVTDGVAGAVQFSVDGTQKGLPVPVAAGKATVDLSGLSVQVHPITALFAPANADRYAGSQDADELTVAKASQTITFALTSTTGKVGEEQTLLASGGKSGVPVVFTSTSDTCTIDGTTLTLVAKGACKVTASQAGNENYTEATAVEQTVTVAQVVTTTVLSFDNDTPVYGEKVTATATVTGAVAGKIQFRIDDETVGDPIALDTNGKATLALADGLNAGGHPVKAVFTPTNLVTYAGSSSELVLPVAQARTQTKVTVRSDEASVAVTTVAPGVGTPSGTVTFTYGGTTTLPVVLVDGKATLKAPIPDGTAVSVAYSGSTNFAESSDSTLRTDPKITFKISGTKSDSGWYRTAVTISFTCTAGSGAIIGGCPADVLLSENGASQGATRTIEAADGGIATVSVTGINIDLTKPEVRALGVTEGQRFFSSAPVAGCFANDALSGVQQCTASREVDGKDVTYTVEAVDQAGNVSTKVVHATTYNRGILKAPYADGVYTVKAGETYTLVAKSSKQARVLKPTTGSKKPTKNGDKFKATAIKGEWALGYKIGTSLKPGTTYNLGIKTTARYSIKIHVIA